MLTFSNTKWQTQTPDIWDKKHKKQEQPDAIWVLVWTYAAQVISAEIMRRSIYIL